MADMAKLEEDYQEAMANANKATSEDEKLYWLGEAKGISDAMEHIEEESRAAKEAFPLGKLGRSSYNSKRSI